MKLASKNAGAGLHLPWNAKFSSLIAGVFAVTLGAGAAAGTFFGTAPAFASLFFLILVSIVAGCAVAATTGLIVAVSLRASRTSLAAGPAAAVLVLMSGAVAWFALSPVPHLAAPKPDPRGPSMMWTLSTGSRLAVWVLPGQGVRRQTPVIVFHGGPGEFTTREMMQRGELLRRAGFDTVYFDQAGTGASDIVPVGDYTFSRAIADVEALRARLGVRKIVLYGFSFGSMLAGAYAAHYSQHVAGAILMSPGPFPGLHAPEDNSRSSVKRPPHFGLKMNAYFLLVARSPVLAEQWIGQSESRDISNALYVRSDHSGGGCKGVPATRAYDTDPMGFNIFPSVLIAADLQDQDYSGPVRMDIPALVLRGQCDKISPLMARRYASVFSPSTFVEIAGAGHRLEEHRAEIDSNLAHFIASDLRAVP